VIIHAVPGFIAPSEYGAGNWKAVEATAIALERAGLTVRRVTFDESDPSTLLEHIPDDARHILIEYSAFPWLIEQLRRAYPHVGVHVRTHNAEPLQHLSRARSGGLRTFTHAPVWRRSARLLLNDLRCRHYADNLFGISEWDDSHYWRLLPGRAALWSFPYFSPWPYLRPDVEPEPWAARKPVIMCLGGNFDPSGMANVANFQQLADRLTMAMNPKWSFHLTWWSKWHDRVPEVHGAVEILRDVSEPWDLLCEVRGLAVLTPLGFGLKTTVVDGLAAGCRVIVHTELARHLPSEVAAACVLFDPAERDLEHIVSALMVAPEREDLNERLRDQAVDVLRGTLTKARSVQRSRSTWLW
jgi:hypothetical protein